MNVFDLAARITLDTSDYEHQLNESSKNTSQFADKLKSGLNKAAKFGAAAMTAAGTAIIGLGKIGLDYNSQMEQYTTNFTTMLGSQEAAIAKVEELKEFAAKTPFEMSGLASATQTLLSFGIEADDTMGIMKMLGDVSLGDSQKFDSLALVFGQVSSQGKLMGQDLLQMINAGFNPLQVISEHTGESMASLKDRMSEGEITIEDVTQAFQWATEEGGKFYNGMEAGAQTTQGLISTLKDNIQAKLGEAFQSVSDKLHELLPQAIEFVDSINVDAVVETVQNLIDAFVNLAPVIAAATAAIAAYKTAVAFTSLVDAAVKSVKAYQAANEGATVAQALLNTTILANPFALIASLIAAVVVALGTLWVTNEDFRNAVKGIWEDIKNAFTGAWDAIKGAWDSVKGFFSDIWSGIKDTFSGVRDWFSEKFASAKEAASNAWSDAKSKFKSHWENIKGAFGDVKGWFSEKFTSAKDKAVQAWESAKDKFRGVVDKLKSFLKFDWSLPKIKLPHFSISGKFSLNPPSIPHFSVSWYKKAMDNAMLLNDATIFGMSGNTFLGGGEAGPEVVSGADTLMKMITKAVKGSMGAPVININVNGANIQDDQELAERIAFEMQRIFDRKAAVFGT